MINAETPIGQKTRIRDGGMTSLSRTFILSSQDSESIMKEGTERV